MGDTALVGMEEERLSNVCSLSCQATPWSASSCLPHLSPVGSLWNLGRRHDEEDLKDMDDCDEDNDGEHALIIFKMTLFILMI